MRLWSSFRWTCGCFFTSSRSSISSAVGSLPCSTWYNFLFIFLCEGTVRGYFNLYVQRAWVRQWLWGKPVSLWQKICTLYPICRIFPHYCVTIFFKFISPFLIFIIVHKVTMHVTKTHLQAQAPRLPAVSECHRQVGRVTTERERRRLRGAPGPAARLCRDLSPPPGKVAAGLSDKNQTEAFLVSSFLVSSNHFLNVTFCIRENKLCFVF